VKGTVLKLLSF